MAAASRNAKMVTSTLRLTPGTSSTRMPAAPASRTWARNAPTPDPPSPKAMPVVSTNSPPVSSSARSGVSATWTQRTAADKMFKPAKHFRFPRPDHRQFQDPGDAEDCRNCGVSTG